MNLISIAFDRFCFTSSLAMPTAVLLSVTIGVGGWGCSISSAAILIGQASLQLWKSPANSASAADESTSFMMLQLMLMGPVCVGGGLFGGGALFGLDGRSDM